MFVRFSSIATLVLSVAAFSQDSTDSIRFEVVSIKAAAPGRRGYSIRPLPGRLSTENVTLKMLVAEAYHTFDFQVLGGPKWTDSERFDLEGKAAGHSDPPRKQLRAMLANALADRFALKLRRENREMQVYTLAAAKAGSKLRAAKEPDKPEMFRLFQRRQIRATNSPLESLTGALTFLVGRPVLDRTGLQGTFDFNLDWAPDELQTRSSEAPVDTSRETPPLDTALQQQLGLKLVLRKEPLEILVIESAEQPSAN